MSIRTKSSIASDSVKSTGTDSDFAGLGSPAGETTTSLGTSSGLSDRAGSGPVGLASVGSVASLELTASLESAVSLESVASLGSATSLESTASLESAASLESTSLESTAPLGPAALVGLSDSVVSSTLGRVSGGGK